MADTMIKRKEDILLDIEEKLKEEKWTRAAIESYSVKNFIELDSTIRLALDENYKDELKSLCKEYLKHNQNSVVGLYIVGVLSLEESSVDDTHLPQIIKLFMDNKKYKIAEFLAEKLLSYRENKFSLKILETLYESYGNMDELFNIKKRLVLIDSKDAANAKFLGEYYEKQGDKDQAMFYYRLAMERYFKSKSVKLAEELWNKVTKLYPEDHNLLIAMSKKAREVLGDERVADMVYNDFVRNAIKHEKYDKALKVLKVIIDFKQGDKVLRKAIEDCYRNIYKNHSQLEKYLKLSAIGQSWKPYKEAIRVFESHIAFDQEVFVSHKSWGVGTVKDIQNDKVTIDFEGKKNHEMSLEIALRALSILDPQNIVIWKNFKKEELKKLMQESPLQVLEIILRSKNGEASAPEVKACLVPDMLKDNEWAKWWNGCKRQMENSTSIIQNPTKRNIVELRESEMTLSEEIVSKFKKTTTFENKVKLFVEFVMSSGKINTDEAISLVNYFSEIIKAQSESNEKKLVSLTALKYANYEGYNDNLVDSSIIFSIKNLFDLYQSLEVELKKPFLIILMKKLKDWDHKFLDFISHSNGTKLDRFMLNELDLHEKYEVINGIFVSSMNSFQENPELFIWISKVMLEESSSSIKERIGIKESEIIFRLLSLLDILNAEIEMKSNVGRNKKVITAIYDLLFKKKVLAQAVEVSDETTNKSILSLIRSSVYLEEELKNEYGDKIISLFPALKKINKQEKIVIRHPFLVTRFSLSTKKSEMARIMAVDIPENSKAIGEAMEKGDLRENAEYKAALEKQDQLKAAASKLESEINQAKILDHSQVNTSIIDVGTKVALKNQDGKKEEYQILGAWDLDFKKHVISYHSPLGKALLDKKIGDEVDFDFNGEKKRYEVMGIQLADFE
jgi:transcription elongation factor GreA